MWQRPRRLRPRSAAAALFVLAASALTLVACGDGDGGGTVERLYGAQANQLNVYDLETDEISVLIPSAANGGNDVNGQVCLLPDGSGNFLMGEDTDQGEGARQGWGIFSPGGELVGKVVEPQTEGEAQQVEPFGCAFDAEDRLFVTDVGSGDFDAADGKLIVYFPPAYESFCILDATLRVPGTVGIDDENNVYTSETVPPGHVLRFAPPYPADGESCDATPVNRSTFIEDEEMSTPFGVARAGNGNWYVSSVALPPAIREYTADGGFVRVIAEGDDIGNPAGLAVASDGTLYYADLGLVDFAPAEGQGSVRRVRFEDGNPTLPEIIGQAFNFPDAVSILEVAE